MGKNVWIIISFLGAIGVLLGAFGAHLLQESISAKTMNAFETGVKYLFIHLFAAGFAVYFNDRHPLLMFRTSIIGFLSGIWFFSGSLVLYALLESIGLSGIQWIVYITPFGGLLFVTAWILMGIGFIKLKIKNPRQ